MLRAWDNAVSIESEEECFIHEPRIGDPVLQIQTLGIADSILFLSIGHKRLGTVDHTGISQGMCGASSGSIPTDVGQPLIRVSSITVGGR